MTVKTGQAWAGLFVTLDATGALEAGTPSGVLYVDGVADEATVTITGSNPYKWSVTLPSLTAGQRVDMYITATISTIATAGIVASEQADTLLLSDGVAVASIGTDAITADALKADAVAEIQSGLATSANLQTVDDNVDAVKAKTDNIPASPAEVGSAMTLTAAYDKAKDDVLTPLAVVDSIVDGLKTTLDNIHDTDLPAVKTETAAIKAKTDTITTPPTAASVADAVWDEAIADHTTATTFGGKNQKVVPSETINDYKADVSGLATSSALTAVDDLVDDLETRLTAVRAGYLDKLNVSGTLAHSNDADTYKADVSAITGAALSASGIDAILDEIVVGTYTMRQILKLMAAKMHGKATGGGTTSIKYTGLDNVADVIIETVDTNGNRSAVSLTV